MSRLATGEVTPEEMKRNDLTTYDHCLGNFWGMVVQDVWRLIDLEVI